MYARLYLYGVKITCAYIFLVFFILKRKKKNSRSLGCEEKGRLMDKDGMDSEGGQLKQLHLLHL